MLDRRVSAKLRTLIVVVLSSVPTFVVLCHFDSRTGFLRLIEVGQEWRSRALPQIQPFLPPAESRFGCDGQFYAQVAVDPSLHDQNLGRACDDPAYRSRRILLPFLSWCAGMGRPFVVLNAYALANLLCWYVLLAALLLLLKPHKVRDWLCVAAIVWTAGVLLCVRYAFVDLAAATLLMIAAAAPVQLRSSALALAILTKESYVICGWSVVVDAIRSRYGWSKLMAHCAIMLGPIGFWTWYVQRSFPGGGWHAADYGWPMQGWLGAIAGLWRDGDLDGLAAASLLVQFIYLGTHSAFESSWWRFGVTFAIGAALLSGAPFVDSVSFTRDLIPLTIAFNVALAKQHRAFLRWFLAGNCGLIVVLLNSLFSPPVSPAP